MSGEGHWNADSAKETSEARAAGYGALIRTFNSAATLPATLEALAAQTLRPAQYVFVDSGSKDQTTSLFPPGSIQLDYVEREFSYAGALNLGFARVTQGCALVISSHTTLLHSGALRYAMNLLETEPSLGAAYFADPRVGELGWQRIDRDNFDGFNGLWNTCALIRTSLVHRRGFRREVFAAEDQEWARWLFHDQGLAVARIEGCGMRVGNPRKASSRKRLNEYVAIAYYAHRELLRPRNVLRLLERAVRGGGELSSAAERMHHVRLALHLAACWLRPPRGRSRYF